MKCAGHVPIKTRDKYHKKKESLLKQLNDWFFRVNAFSQSEFKKWCHLTCPFYNMKRLFNNPLIVLPNWKSLKKNFFFFLLLTYLIIEIALMIFAYKQNIFKKKTKTCLSQERTWTRRRLQSGLSSIVR